MQMQSGVKLKRCVSSEANHKIEAVFLSDYDCCEILRYVLIGHNEESKYFCYFPFFNKPRPIEIQIEMPCDLDLLTLSKTSE